GLDGDGVGRGGLGAGGLERDEAHAPPAPEEVEGEVRRDRAEPRAERAALLEALARRERAEERLLREVLGVAAHERAQVEDEAGALGLAEPADRPAHGDRLTLSL